MSAVDSDDDYGGIDYDSALEETLRTIETQAEAGVKDIEDAAAALALSPFDEFRRRNWLSVSDLIGTVWCEVQFDYRLRTQPWLKPADRPTIITSTKGAAIPIDKVKVEDKERILRRGETIHKRLEREIHPAEIKVAWVTEEDKWGLRLLNMLAAMEALLTLNKCRELPVVGFVDDILVFGIIDELTREPVEKSKTKPETRSTRTSASRQATLDDFFGGTRPRTHRVFVSDSKTRAGGTMPREEDTVAGRLQCMLYKELLDSLLVTQAPSESSGSQAKEEAANCHTACEANDSTETSLSTPSLGNEDAEVVNNTAGTLLIHDTRATDDNVLSKLPTRSPHGSGLWRVFDHLELDPKAPFTDMFIRESRPVVGGNDLRFGADTGRTLADYAQVWESYVAALGLGTHNKQSPQDGVTEDNLELVYRRASGKRKDMKSSKKRRKGRKEKKRATVGQATEEVPHDLHLKAESAEDGDLQRAIELSLMDVQPQASGADTVASGAAVNPEEPVPGGRTGVYVCADTLNRDEEGIVEYAGVTCAAPVGWWGERTTSPPPTTTQALPAASQPPSTPSSVLRNSGIDCSPASFVTAREYESPIPVHMSVPDSAPSRPVSRQSHYFDSDSEADREAVELAWAAEMSLTQDAEPSIEVRVLHAEVSPPRRSRSASPSPVSGSIIGRHAFRHDRARLAAHLSSVLAYWMGEREPLGVPPHDVRKCGWCEFEEGCEWREMKAREAMLAYRARSGQISHVESIT